MSYVTIVWPGRSVWRAAYTASGGKAECPDIGLVLAADACDDFAGSENTRTGLCRCSVNRLGPRPREQHRGDGQRWVATRVGRGQSGAALSRHMGSEPQGPVVAAFHVFGTSIAGIPVHGADRLAAVIAQRRTWLGMMTVPAGRSPGGGRPARGGRRRGRCELRPGNAVPCRAHRPGRSGPSHQPTANRVLGCQPRQFALDWRRMTNDQ